MSNRDLTLRPADQTDIAAIDGLLARSYPRLLATDYDPTTLAVALPMMAVTAPALLVDRTYYVAQISNRIVGAGGWTRQVPGHDQIIPGRGHIRRLIVDDRMVRQGIAAALITRSHFDAAAAGLHEMCVLSTHTAVAFYTALGYITIRSVDVPLGPTGVLFPSVEMHRPLSP